MAEPSPTQPAGGEPLPAEVRNWAMAAHLSAFLFFVSIPPVVGPLVVWLVKRNEHPYIDEHAKEALNFNISVLIYGLVAGALIIVLIGIPLIFAVGIFWFVVVVIAAVRASNGESYRYPLTIRLVK